MNNVWDETFSKIFQVFVFFLVILIFRIDKNFITLVKFITLIREHSISLCQQKLNC